jgi:hypothetical protein
MAIALSNIINIFATPTEVFQNIKTTPKWLIAFLFIAVVSIIFGLLLLPFMQKIMEQTLLAKMSDEQVQQTLSTMTGFRTLGLLLAAVPLLIKLLLYSLFLYLSAIIFDAQEINFKNIYAVVVHSELILLLMGVFNVLILLIKGVDAVNNITDLNAIIGLDYFLADKSHSIPLFTFLNSFNVFSVWYVATLTIGISVVTGFSKQKSAILVSSIWLLGVGLQVALAMFSTNMQHMAGN